MDSNTKVHHKFHSHWLTIFGINVYLSYGLYMLGGDIMFMCFYVFYVSCFTYGTLIIDLYYEVIYGICIFMFVKLRS